jgi:hypothetical protein
VSRACSAACRSSRAPQSTCRCSCGGATHGAAHTAQQQQRGARAPAGDDDRPEQGPRAHAVEAGDLVEAHPDIVRDARFNCPVAITRAAWQDCVAWDDQDTRQIGMPQDETGRQYDVVRMAGLAFRRGAATTTSPGHDEVRFAMLRVPRDQGRIRIDDLDDGQRTALCEVTLKAQYGPDDSGKPAVTIMTVDEDWSAVTSRWEVRADEQATGRAAGQRSAPEPCAFTYTWARNDEERRRELLSHLIRKHDRPAWQAGGHLYQLEEEHAEADAEREAPSVAAPSSPQAYVASLITPNEPHVVVGGQYRGERVFPIRRQGRRWLVQRGVLRAWIDEDHISPENVPPPPHR